MTAAPAEREKRDNKQTLPITINLARVKITKREVNENSKRSTDKIL